MRLVILSLAAFAFTGSAAFAEGPSFDCKKAKAEDEIAICGDERLAELDRLTNAAYEEALQASGRESARGAARDGLDARSACGSDVDCILAAQVNMILIFQELGALVELPGWAIADAGLEEPSAEANGLPTEVGQCVETAIARITSRFVEDINENTDDGSAVEYENGGRQVSYEKEQPLINSSVGDPVMMCLVSIPQDCPPGDDRGRIYTTTNQRTSESWTLPDSQHSCGGA
jgi:uncharacterized protein